MSSSSKEFAKKVALIKPADWDLWLSFVKTRANYLDVWHLVNPDLPEKPEIIAKPTLPIPPVPVPGQTLTEAQKSDYTFLNSIYKNSLKEYEKQRNALGDIVSFIQETISTTNAVHIEHAGTNPWDILVALKKKLAPTDDAREIFIEAEYARVCKGPKNQDIDKWIDDWMRVYTQAKQLNLPDSVGRRPVRHFILALEHVYPQLVTTALFELQRAPETFTVDSIVEQVRNVYRMKDLDKKNVASAFTDPTSSTFSTDNSNSNRTPTFRGNAAPLPECICGMFHWFSDCFYFNPEKAFPKWKPRPEIQQKIEEAMENPKFKEKVERSLKRRRDGEANSSRTPSRTPRQSRHSSPTRPSDNRNSQSQRSRPQPSNSYPIDSPSPSPNSYPPNSSAPNNQTSHRLSFPIYTSSSFSSFENSLRTSWILDHGSNTHLCNNTMKHRFTKDRDGCGETLIAGTQILRIEAYGSIDISFKGPNNDTETITLRNVSYISNFMTNIVSGSILASKGLHFDTMDTRLHINGTTLGYAPLISGHYFMEHPLISTSSASSAKSSASNATSSASADFRLMTHAVNSSNTAKDWHNILAHAGQETIQHLESSVEGISISGNAAVPKTNECETCALSKAHQLISKSSNNSESNEAPFYRITYDLIPLSSAMNRHQWISHVACSTTDFHLVFTHTLKSEATTIIKKALNIIATRFNAKVVFFRSDTEASLGKEFDDIISQFGITHEPSAPYTPQQNGHSERLGGILMMKARALRIGSSLPNNLWPWIVRTAGYIMNRTPMKRLQWKTPFEKVTGVKPNLSHMHQYGCKAYALDKNIPKKEKLQERAHIGFLLGYDSTNIFFIWIPSKRKVIRTRDVVFDDTSFYDPSEPDLYHLIEEPMLDTTLDLPTISRIITELSDSDSDTYEAIQNPQNPQSGNSDRDKSRSPDAPRLQLPTPTPDPTITDSTPMFNPSSSSLPSRPRGFEPTPQAPHDISSKFDESNILPEGTTRKRTRKQLHSTALEQATKNINAYHKSFLCFAPARSYYSNFISTTSSHCAKLISTSNPHSSKLISTTNSNSAPANADKPSIPPLRSLHRDNLPPEPLNFKQMQKHSHHSGFMQALLIEIDALTAKNVWEVVTADQIPSGITPIPTTWVFKYKFDEEGYLLKYKARLCARGDKQETEQETYAATLATRIFRALMAIVAAFDLETRQFDVLNAFVNSELDEPTYCYPPDGWENSKGIYLHLLRALYGLKQAPSLWYKNLSNTLSELGLEPVPGIDCLFVNDFIILFFFVDDIVMMFDRRHVAKADEFQAKLFKAYEMRYLGELQWFLGIRIQRDRPSRKLFLCQDSYIDKLIAKFNVDITLKPPSTPLSYSINLQKNLGQASPADTHSYQQKVGSINFSATITRPDISFHASKLSEFLTNPSSDHIDSANRLLRYLASTKHYAIEYDGEVIDPKSIFLASSDAAFADNPETRHSSQGYCFKLYNGLIDWKATKQRTVTLSSTEAELLAISDTGKELLWWNRFLDSINFTSGHASHIECDNMNTIRTFTTETAQFTTKLRHVDVHRHWLRQEVQKGNIIVTWTPTLKIIADGLTKALPPQRHQEFINLLGLITAPI